MTNRRNTQCTDKEDELLWGAFLASAAHAAGSHAHAAPVYKAAKPFRILILGGTGFIDPHIPMTTRFPSSKPT